jgi:translocation and assembly module TamB
VRALKITAIITVLTTVILSLLLAWLVRTEQGSRWLLQQGLGFSPFTIEASGISGTLAAGLGVENLYIELPLAEIRATDIVASWRPASLLAGIIDIKSARLAELSIDILESTDESAREPGDDQGDTPAQESIDDPLFWLQIPLQITVESGQLDKLRVAAAEFNKLNVAGSIGHGRLEIEKAAAQIAGIDLQTSGELSGPQPGRLQVDASWVMPAENIGGAGSFNGNIDKLAFTQVINLPETVNFNGHIFDLFTGPRLEGMADWQSVRLPGETELYSNNGSITISSDFVSARVSGSNRVKLGDWPEALMQLQAFADLVGVTIENYAIDVFDGLVSGSGEINYGDGLRGQLAINGQAIDTAQISSELPGRLGFTAALQIESADAFAIDVTTAKASIAEKDLDGVGRVQWREGKLAAIDSKIKAGTNQLSADVKLGKQLEGWIKADAPELALLWPGLSGALDASIVLGGSLDQPQGRVTAQATSVSYQTNSLQTLVVNGNIQSDNRLALNLAVTGLVAGNQELGSLDYNLQGTLAEHQSSLKVRDGVVDVELRANGSWDGKRLIRRFDYGLIRPDGFDSWSLEQNPELRLSQATGELSAHCWKQGKSGICIDGSRWDSESLQTAAAINNFALSTLQPLLAEGYSVDGQVNADFKLIRDNAGLQAQMHWVQSATVVSYADNIETFQTRFDQVRIDLESEATQTNLVANLSGEQGLKMNASANVSGPLDPDSPLKAEARGRLPNIALLRPLLQKVADPGELQGDLTINLTAGGTLGDPLFNGGAYLADGILGLPAAGVILREINIAAESKGGDKLLVSGKLSSGEGIANITGEVRATDEPGLAADIRIQGTDLASVRLPNLSVDASPDLMLRISEDVFDISGTLVIPRATAQIRQLPRTAVARSADVIVHAPEGAIEQAKETIITGDVEVVLGDEVRFNGFGLNSRLDGKLRLTQGRGGFLQSSGTVRVRDGFLTGYGKELRVDQGELTFTGPLDDPLVNIQVSRESFYDGRQYTIGLRLTGTAQNIKTEPFSRPTMSERDVLSFLLLDRPATSDSDASGAALALGLQQLLPDQSGRFGLDEVSFETNEANEAAMVAGKRINDKLYVRYVFGTLGQPGAFRIRYTLGRGFSLEASTGARQSMDLIYLLER